MADLTGDRGPALRDLPAEAQEINRSDPYGLVAGFAAQNQPDEDDEQDETDPDEEAEEEEADEKEESEETEAKDGEPEELTEIELEGYGKLTTDDIYNALDAQQELAALLPEVEALKTQSAQYEQIQGQLEGAMHFQRLMQHPQVNQAVQAALNQVLGQNPALLLQLQMQGAAMPGPMNQTRQAQPAGASNEILQRLERMETAERDRQVAAADSAIDTLFKGYTDKFGEKVFSPRVEKQLLQQAVQRYGDRLNAESLRDLVDAHIHRNGFKPLTKPVTTKEQVQKALAKAPKGARLMPAGSVARRVPGKTLPDARKMSNRQFGDFFSGLIGGR